MTSSPSSLTTHIAGEPISAELLGVRWAKGIFECRFRLLHPTGSLIAEDGGVGQVVADHEVECTTCSDACAI